jgi:hypothetical protein
VRWVVRLAEAGAEGPGVEIMEISRSGDLGDIANLAIGCGFRWESAGLP